MAVGETFVGKGHHVQRYWKDSGIEIANGSGNAVNRCKLVAHYDHFQTAHGLAFDDVVMLVGVNESGTDGEKFWFARGFGMVQWQAPSHYDISGTSCVTEIHGIGQRPDNVREVVGNAGIFVWA